MTVRNRCIRKPPAIVLHYHAVPRNARVHDHRSRSRAPDRPPALYRVPAIAGYFACTTASPSVVYYTTPQLAQTHAHVPALWLTLTYDTAYGRPSAVQTARGC